METRSKARIGQAPEPDPEPARGTPETSVLRASPGSGLDLTVLMDDGEAGVVGPGHPAVTATTTTTSPGTISLEQDRDAAGNIPVREPEYDNGSPSDDTVTERHRTVSNPALFYSILKICPDILLRCMECRRGLAVIILSVRLSLCQTRGL